MANEVQLRAEINAAWNAAKAARSRPTGAGEAVVNALVTCVDKLEELDEWLVTFNKPGKVKPN